ncbi:hypothetical protein QZH41_000867, partial [Actinostola sp. cb2023]
SPSARTISEPYARNYGTQITNSLRYGQDFQLNFKPNFLTHNKRDPGQSENSLLELTKPRLTGPTWRAFKAYRCQATDVMAQQPKASHRLFPRYQSRI